MKSGWIIFALGALLSLQVSAQQVQEKASESVSLTELMNSHNNALNLPCPFGWSVIPNPSQEDSLSYLNESGQLAVSVTYIKNRAGASVDPEAYARVAAEQLKCSLPARSNLLANGWSFTCEDSAIEALVYGEPGDLVLLAISGRSADTEQSLERFIDFLYSQARR
ncbi:MAG: hypothetical protein K6F05_01500 [Succinivibrio sp.]|nr:hypothetical protein [Succinivibrio sp.]